MVNCTQEQVIEVIGKTLKELFEIDLGEQAASVPIGDLGLDSMAVLDIIVAIEDFVGTKIRKFDLQRNPTIEDIAAMVMQNIATENAHVNC